MKSKIFFVISKLKNCHIIEKTSSWIQILNLLYYLGSNPSKPSISLSRAKDSWLGKSRFNIKWRYGYKEMFRFLILKSSLNTIWERKWYSISPMKNPKLWFFGLNMKFSVCIDYARNISKILRWGRGEREYDCLPTFWNKKSNLVHKYLK